MARKLSVPADYPVFLSVLKERIRTARLKAALSVNQELVMLYWSIGRDILKKRQEEGWGTKIIERLSKDLRIAFPGMRGFSVTNLAYMRAFAEAYPDSILQMPSGELPWSHHIALLEKVKNREEREWYAHAAIENGWSHNVLVLHIESRLYERQGKALTNFSRTLPAPQSDLAQQVTKGKYNFEFLSLPDDAEERKIERGLIDHLRDFILELGKGFAFVGSQYPLESW